MRATVCIIAAILLYYSALGLIIYLNRWGCEFEDKKFEELVKENLDNPPIHCNVRITWIDYFLKLIGWYK